MISIASVELLTGGYTFIEVQSELYRATKNSYPKRTIERWMSELGIQAEKPAGKKRGRLYSKKSLKQLKFAAKQRIRGLTFSEIRQQLLRIEENETPTNIDEAESEPIEIRAIAV